MCLKIPAPLWDEQYARHLLRRYWATLPDGFPAYTGSRFERFAGGGDRPAAANRFTADDLVAVATLSVQIPATAALRLLEPGSAELYNALLAHIPSGVRLEDADSDLIADGSPVWKLWDLLQEIDGIGSVRAGKLLARKRPHLIPVYDHVIKHVFERDASDLTFWSDLHCALRAHDQRLRRHLEACRAGAGFGDEISLIRVLDTMAWLHGKDTGLRADDDGLDGLDDEGLDGRDRLDGLDDR